MKRLSVSKLVFFILIISIGSTNALTGQGVNPPKSRIVKAKPVRPNGHFYRPTTLKTGYVWRDGCWKWNKRKHTYVWTRGYYVKKRQGKTWKNGHWSKVRGGWVYRPGFWA